MSSAEVAAVARSWPLVGRAAELDLADQTLAEGRFRALILAGSPGVGKTRLAQEILRRAEATGCRTRWVRAGSGTASLPLGAFSALLPDLRGISRLELLGQITAHLESLAEGRRLVIGIDDAHQLDETSVALVHQLASSGAAFLVLTLRRGIPVNEPLVALWKDGLAERFEVTPLARSESNELVRAALGGQVDGTTLHELFELSRGNTLFLRELVLGGLQSGVLTATGGVWRWNGPITVAPRLVELIEARMGQLDAPRRAVLELVAFGEPLPAPVADALGGEVTARLEELERVGLLTVDLAGGRMLLRLAHPLYGEVLRARTPALRARAVYRQLSQAAAEQDVGSLRLATWRLAAGEAADPHQLVDAADDALRTLDFRSAEQLARAAIQAGAGPVAHRLLGTALARSGRASEAEAVFARVPTEYAGVAERFAITTSRAINLQWRLGRPAAADAVLDQAIRDAADPAARDELIAVKAGFLHYDLNCVEALRVVQPILERAGTGRAARVRALTVASEALGATGRCDAAAAAAHEALELAVELPELDALVAGALHTARIGALLWGGHLDEAHALARAAYQRAITRHSSFEIAAYAGWLAAVARAQGRLETARTLNREAVERGRAPEVRAFRRFLPRLLAELARTTAMRGDAAEAEAALAEACGLDDPPSRILRFWAALARPWTAAARGHFSRAAALSLELADRAAELGLVTFELVALHDALRFEPAVDVAGRLTQLLTQAEGPLAAAYAAHARALAAGDAAGLDRAAEDFAALGARLYAAETATHAALAYRRAGSTAHALASATRARDWAAHCEGPRTPPLRLLEAPPALTPRELEIAQLAARGQSSKDIAEHLVISVRTVDNTLHEVYAKLGINRRVELASIFRVPAPRRSSGPSNVQHRSGRGPST